MNTEKSYCDLKAAASRAGMLATSFAAGLIVLLIVLHTMSFEEPAPIVGYGAVRFLFVLAVLQLLIAPFAFRFLFRHSAADVTKEDVERSFVTATAISFALREAVAIYGLVITVLTGERAWGETLTVAALTAMVLSWPRETILRNKLETGI